MLAQWTYFDEGQHQLKSLAEKEHEEDKPITLPHTVADPGTMMIISSDTMITMFTMLASQGLN